MQQVMTFKHISIVSSAIRGSCTSSFLNAIVRIILSIYRNVRLRSSHRDQF